MSRLVYIAVCLTVLFWVGSALSFPPRLEEPLAYAIVRESKDVGEVLGARDGQVLFRPAKIHLESWYPEIARGKARWIAKERVILAPSSNDQFRRGTAYFFEVFQTGTPLLIDGEHYKDGTVLTTLYSPGEYYFVGRNNKTHIHDEADYTKLLVSRTYSSSKHLSAKTRKAHHVRLGGELHRVAWDYTNNIPAVPHQWYALVTRAIYKHPPIALGLALLLGLSALCCYMAEPSRGKTVALFLLVLSLVASLGLWNGFLAVERQNIFEFHRAFYLEHPRNEQGYHLPLPPQAGFPKEGEALVISTYIWIPLFAMFLIQFAKLAPAIIPSIHYLLVRHPAEKEVKVALREKRPVEADELREAVYNRKRDGIPQAWKSRNLARRVRELTRRVREETHLTKEVTERERRR